ncbi:MAG: neutral/alkaline non-lysosomal ceramidase N-terminal domain-containing protein [Spirochaetia bacterium]|nr:neutral/alkaline non-lysosomal ceramidase N-terminal domain-containing protein [Spirochaetia bacterium]
MSELKIGFAQVDFTPKVNLPLLGNFRDTYEARGVHDPLMAKSAVFSDAKGNLGAILALDLCMVSRANVGFLRKEISSKTKIGEKNIFISATHTHAAPAPMAYGVLPAASEKDVKSFLSKAALAVVEAKRRMKPRALHAGSTRESGVSFVRRLRGRDGKTRMNWERPEPASIEKVLGEIDPELSVLAAGDPANPDGLIVHFGLHPAILAGNNWDYSADYPGVIASTLSRLLGKKDLVIVFLTGCCGNVNHLDYLDPLQGRGFKEVERIGTALGLATFDALQKTKKLKGNRVAIVSEKVSVPRHSITDTQLVWAKKILAGEEKDGGLVDGLPPNQFATQYVKMAEVQHLPDECEVQAIRIGDAAILGFPGEVFAETGTEVKKKSPAKVTLPVMLAGDAVGYLPTRKAYAEGGYESLVGSTLYAPGAVERLRDAGIDILRKLFKQTQGVRS